MTKIARLRAKTYSYLIYDGSNIKKAKDTKNCVLKKLKFGNHKSCLEATQLENKIKQKHNLNCSRVPDYPWRILTAVGSGSGKITLLFNLTSQQPNIDKIVLDAKDPFEAKYQLLMNKRESTD